MTDSSAYETSLERLRGLLAYCRAKDSEFRTVDNSGAEVLARYQPVFSKEHVTQLAVEEMKPFLLFENNKYWTGLQVT